MPREAQAIDRPDGDATSEGDDATIEVTPDAPRRDSGAFTALLLGAYAVIAVVMTFPDLSRFRTHIAGDSGDSLLELWVLRRVEIGLPHGWHALWNPPVFFPAHDVLAYSDTLFPVALVHWPLRSVVGDVAAFNLIYLGSWVLSAWCVYALARRFVTHRGAAFVAGLVYTYAAIRLVHQQHFQLVVGGALVPLVLLLMLRLLDRPSVGRGVALGLSFTAVTLTASYYGALLAVVLAIVAVGWLIAQRPGELRSRVRALGVAAIVAVVLVAPFGVQYLRLQRQPEFRRGFAPDSAAHIEDFLSTGSNSRLLSHVPVISADSRPSSRLIENRLFPGFVATIFGIAGVAVLIAEIRRRGWRVGRARELVLIGLAGIAGLVLSFGDWFRFDGHRVFLPFAVFRHAVPGFSGIRAVARLSLSFQLALALFAAVGIELLLRHVRGRGARIAVASGLALIVLAESAMGLIFVRVPTPAGDGGVAQALRARVPGIVAELPMGSSARGAVWPYAESPRQLLALRDHDPRLNGYSGFQPKGFDEVAAAINRFPDPDSLTALRRHGVRYVVLRTALVGALTPSVLTPQIGADGAGRYTRATAETIVGRIPPGVARRVDRLPGAILVELAP